MEMLASVMTRSSRTRSNSSTGKAMSNSASNSHPEIHPDDLRPAATHELMSPEQNVQRIMWTGTAWFGVVVGSIAVTMGLLLSSGWRPTDLPIGLGVLWWFSAVIVVLSVGLIGWSGCPVLEVSVPVADRNKTRTMQLGTLLFIVGSALSLAAVLLGPAH
jgi:hypothetical protein